MPKRIEDLRQLWQETAAKAGLSQDAIDAFAAGLGNPDVVKVFRQAFVPVPEHHSTLDETKQDVEARKAALDRWYHEEAKPAYETNLAGIERLRRYETTYGEIDPNSATIEDANALGMSKAELDQYLDDRLRAERAGFTGLAKAIPKMTIDYFNRFKKVLDPDEVEKISVAEGLPPDLAYERYIAPEVEKQRETDLEAKLKEAEERGRQDAISTYKIPVDSTPKESSPFHDREIPEPGKELSEVEQDRASRNSFIEAWNEHADSISNKHRP